LFGWEILAQADKCGFTASCHLIYYAEREGSITNRIDTNYFHKKLILEKEQIKFLKKVNLLDLYKSGHLDGFVKNWYCKKYSEAENKGEALLILEEILNLYGKTCSEYGVI